MTSLLRLGRASGLLLSRGLGPDDPPPCPPGGTDPFQVSWSPASQPTWGPRLPRMEDMGSHVPGQPAFSVAPGCFPYGGHGTGTPVPPLSPHGCPGVCLEGPSVHPPAGPAAWTPTPTPGSILSRPSSCGWHSSRVSRTQAAGLESDFPLRSCVTLSKSLTLAVPWFPAPYNGAI